MRYSRVLLVSPPSSSYLGAARPPQNLGFLAQALLENDLEYDVLDMRLNYKFKHLVENIERFRPDLIGFTLVSLQYKRSYDLIKDVKKRFPQIRIIVGGPHVTVLQETVFAECPEIDYGVVHEGEATLVELCQDHIQEENIEGLIHRDNGTIIYNGHRKPKKALDEISWPRYEKFEMKKYIAEMPFNSSRGCPHRCIFCPNKMITKKFRWRSPENVVDEIEYWYMKGYRVFNYDDDNFGFFPERVYAICNEIERRGIRKVEFRCSNGLRADKVDRPLLKRMREVGFNYIAFGIDGGNNKMLKLNKKGETIEQIEDAIKNATELGFDVKIFVITGMPGETMEDIEDSLRFVQKYPVRRVLLNNPIPYPGTELFEIVKDNNLFIKQPEEYLNFVTENEAEPVFTTPELGYEDRVKILKRCRSIEKIVTRRGIQHMYKKYLFFGTLAGYVFATNFVEHLFFKNKIFRRIMEHIRYKRLLARNRILPAE